INARKLWFVLDTGNKYAVVGLRRARELGLKQGQAIPVRGEGADVAGSFIKDATYTIPGLPGFSQPINLAIPLDNLAPRLGHDFDGILGSDFIEMFVVEVDYQARILRLHDPKTFKYSGTGASIPIKINGSGHPVFKAEVTPVGRSPIKGDFVLDIGSGSALNLRSPFVKENNLPGPAVKTVETIGSGGAGGDVTGRTGRVASFRIGRFTISRPFTFFSADAAGANARQGIAGSIGEPITSKFKLFLDYSHERIILEPNATFPAPFDHASAGMLFEAEGKDYRTYRVKQLLKDGPAELAGLKLGDVILSIDDRTASELTFTQILELFERPVSYRLKVQRAGAVVEIVLKPERMI
ncbi:MAG: PDZ domain-containing protein, partial [bacterium]